MTGSTSLANVEDAGAVGAPADTYSQCAEDVLNGTVQAMSTDGSILLGLAAQNEGELKVVGEEFSEERIGVGYSQDHPEMCEWINGVLRTPSRTAPGPRPSRPPSAATTSRRPSRRRSTSARPPDRDRHLDGRGGRHRPPHAPHHDPEGPTA